MGNAQDCSKIPKKYVRDPCEVSMHDFGELVNFCTLGGPAGDKFRNAVCNESAPEFQGVKNTGTCHYNDCDNKSSMGAGCCKHPAKCCAIIGRGAACRRVAFYGDPADCCLRNSSCKDKWVSDSDCQDAKHYTCSDGKNDMPNHRALTGKDCKGPLRDYFLGKNTDIQTTISRWMDRSSLGATFFVDRVIHEGANCLTTIDDFALNKDSEGVVYASGLVRDFIHRFNRDARPLHIPTARWTSTYHEVQEVLYLLASKYPIVFDGVLYDICSETTLEDLAASSDLTRWCGCHMVSNNYQSYATDYGLNKVCSPMCTREGTVPSVDGDGSPETCKQSVCIVSNVGVTTDRSKIGNISISQMCSHCKSKDSCRCVIDGVDIKISNSDIDGSEKAVQELCTDTLCTVDNPAVPGTKLNIPCSGPSVLYYQYLQKVRERDKKDSGLVISICMLLVFMLIAVIVLRMV